MFFPTEIKYSKTLKGILKPSNPNGGWGDIRDHELCLLNAKFPHMLSSDVLLNSNHSNSETYLSFNSILKIL